MKLAALLGLGAAVAVPAVAQQPAAGVVGALLGPNQPDAAIAARLKTISAAEVQADITHLVGFRTRNTLSSMDTTLPAGEGILAAASWIQSQFEAISRQCGGCLEVKTDDFVEPASGPGGRIPKPTRLVNVYAVMHGTAGPTAPWVLVTGHYDSRATDVLNDADTAPGANDDASGVAVSLESARALAGMKLPGTIVFVAVAGEEQGLDGSRHLAKLARAEKWPLEAVLNNDIVGGDTTPGETAQRKGVVRVFSENVPATATPQQEREMLTLGAENDSPSRELARQIAELAPAYFPGDRHGAAAATGELPGQLLPVMVLRRDRYLRGGDHTSFNAEGFTAVRFTEWRENFNHQHQHVRVEGGVQYGDLLPYVDFAYTAKVARLNAAVLASLADAPSPPQEVKVLTRALDNSTQLEWQPGAYAPAGTTYQVVWRATDEPLWTHAVSAGTGTQLKLDVSKDNVLFGVRAVAPNGHRSLPVPPLPARQ